MSYYSEDELRELFDFLAGNEHHKKEIATREINSFTDIEITWQPEKKGRKVVGILFEIRERDAWGRLKNYQNAEKEIDGQLSLLDYKD